MGKRCLFCGQFFIPDPRVKDRQKACHRELCKKKRKAVAQQRWCESNPGYFQGRYPYVKQWREKKRLSSGTTHSVMIQDKIPLLEPCLRLILVIPGGRNGMIQQAEANQSCEWPEGKYEFKVIGWVNCENRLQPSNLKSKVFHVQITEDIVRQLSKPDSTHPIFITVPVIEWKRQHR